MSRPGFCSLPAQRQSWALTSQAILRRRRLAARRLPESERARQAASPRRAGARSRDHEARRPPAPTSHRDDRWRNQGRPRRDRRRWLTAAAEQLIEHRVGRLAGPHRELDLGVVVEILDEIAAAPPRLRAEMLRDEEAVVVDEPGTIGVDQIEIIVGQLARPLMQSPRAPGCVERTRTATRRIRRSELWMLCVDRPQAWPTSGMQSRSPVAGLEQLAVSLSAASSCSRPGRRAAPPAVLASSDS